MYPTPSVSAEILEQDIMQSTHCLIAGTTGSGKSNLLRRCLLVASAEGYHTYLIDPKGRELGPWKDAVNTAGYAEYPDEIVALLQKIVDLMETRIHGMTGYQRTFDGTQTWVIVDEYADLVDTAPQAAKLIKRLAQKGRAAGIHVLLCTQHPSAKVIDGAIKANFPTRVALHVASAIYSRMIIERGGAELLPYRGMAYLMHESGEVDLYKTSLLPEEEEIRVCEYMKEQRRILESTKCSAPVPEKKKGFFARIFG